MGLYIGLLIAVEHRMLNMLQIKECVSNQALNICMFLINYLSKLLTNYAAAPG